MGSLRGKVIAVTGAASGIALVTAQQAAERGASLALADISADALNKVVEDFKAKGVDVVGTAVDVSNSQSVEAWIKATVEHFGHLDGAANIAGVESRKGANNGFTGITDITDDAWNFVIGVNLTGTFYCLRAELNAMTGGGSIVNISSIAGLMGRVGLGAYASSKHGVIGLTKTAAKEAGKKGIRVNAVCPGAVDTPMLERLLSEYATKTVASTTNAATYKTLPLGRTGAPLEIARAICYLLSDESSYMTGVAMPVDGGGAC